MPDFYFEGMDKLAHLVLFGGLGALVSIGIRRGAQRPVFWVQFWVPVVFVALYGISDEIHQIFVPGRTFDLGDWAADITGGLCAQAFLFVLAWRGTFRNATPAAVEG